MSSTPTIHQRDNNFYYTDEDGVEWALRVAEKTIVTVEIGSVRNGFVDNTMPLAVRLFRPNAIQNNYDLEELHNYISDMGVEVEIKK